MGGLETPLAGLDGTGCRPAPVTTCASAWNVCRGGWSSGLFCSFPPQAARRRGLTRVLVTWIVRSQAIIKPHDSRHMSGH